MLYALMLLLLHASVQ